MGLRLLLDILKKFPADDAVQSMKNIKYIAESAHLRGADKMIGKWGPGGENLIKALKSTNVERYADLGGPWETRFWRDVVPHSPDAVRNNQMYRDLIKLAQDYETRTDALGNVVTLRGPALRTEIQTRWLRAKPSDYSRWNNGWDELESRLTTYKAIDGEVFKEATKAGIPVEFMENHYPHMWRTGDMIHSDFWEKFLEGLAEERGFRTTSGALDVNRAEDYFTREIAPNRHFVSESLEKPRLSNRPDYDRTPVGYLEYLDNASRRIAEWKHFGQNYERVTGTGGWLDTIESTHGGVARSIAGSVFDNNVGRYTRSEAMQMFDAWIGNPLRSAASFRLTPLTTLRNIFQQEYAIYATNTVSYGKALQNYWKNKDAVVQFANESRLISRAGEFANESWMGKVAQVGPTTFWEGELGLSGRGKMQGIVNWHYKNIGMEASERMVRAISGESGRQYLFDLFRKAKQGDKNAVTAIRELIDIADEPSMTDTLLKLPTRDLEKFLTTATDDAANLANKATRRAAWNVVDDTQFGLSGRLKLPAFWQSPFGKFVFQFKTFSYRSAQFWWRTLQRDWKVNKGKALVRALPALAALWGPGYAFKSGIGWLFSREERDPPLWLPEEVGATWQAFWKNVAEPLVTMGVADIFFDMLQSIGRTGSVKDAVIDFVTPAGVSTAYRAIATPTGIVAKRAAKASEWEEIDKLWEMPYEDLGRIATSIPIPSWINVGPLFFRKLMREKQQRAEDTEKAFRRFYGRKYPSKTISPRRRGRMEQRRLKQKYGYR